MDRQTLLARRGTSIERLRQLARRRLPKPVFDFADGGAEDERTLRGNEAAFGDWAFLPRPMQGAGSRDLSVELFGHRLGLPILIGPTGLAGLFWPKGEIAAARAAGRAATVYCLSHGSVCAMEELAKAHDGLRWMQVFIYRDRGFTRELVARAAASGFHALVLTIDNQLPGRRERDLVNGFTIPPRLGALQLLGFAAKWRWCLAMRAELPRLTFGNYVKPGARDSMAGLAGRMAALLDPAMEWRDLAALRAQWSGPLIVKGIMHAQEARQAIALGADALIVSNHGGRQLDGALASLHALPAIVAAADGRVPVLMDGGVRRGTDALKAIALGARAVLIGRPQLWGLAVAGETGVAHVLALFRDELDRAMGLIGARTLAEVAGLEVVVPNGRAGAQGA